VKKFFKFFRLRFCASRQLFLLSAEPGVARWNCWEFKEGQLFTLGQQTSLSAA